MLGVLISVPLAMGYLGAQRYGLWMTMTSVVGMLSAADLGLGNGLMTAVAKAEGEGNRLDARQFISAAFCTLGAVALLLAAMFSVAVPLIDWRAAYNLTRMVAESDARDATMWLLLALAAGLPLGIAGRVQSGLQQGLRSSLWTAVGTVLAVLSTVVGVSLECSLPALVALVAFAPVVASLANTALFFGFQRRDLRPRISAFSWAPALDLLRTGSLFVVLQLSAVLAFTSDNLVIAHVMGQAAVAEYAVAVRLFSLATLVATVFLSPLWPAYSEAIARGDGAWVSSTLWRSMIAGASATLMVSAAVVVFRESLFRLWLGPSASIPDAKLCSALALWSTLSAVGIAIAMMLNGINKIRVQALLGVIVGIASLVAKTIGARALGLHGLVLGTCIAYSLVSLVPMYWYIRPLLTGMGAHRSRA